MVVGDGRVLIMDHGTDAAALKEAQYRAEGAVAGEDRAGRSSYEISPKTFPVA